MEPIAIICEFKENSPLDDLLVFVFRENLLNKFNIAGDFCKQNDDIDCSEKSEFRMPNGLCNNLERPLDGNSHTAFGRLKAADYSDCT
jgi:hypothetical protein